MAFENRYYTGCTAKIVETIVDQDGIKVINTCPVFEGGIVYSKDCLASQLSDKIDRQRTALEAARAARDYFTDVLGCAGCDIALKQVDKTHYSD